MDTDILNVDSFVERHKNNKSALISILQDIQAEYKWLPKEAIIEVAKKLDMPLIDVYAAATFYKAFRLKPRGKYLITVCLGTACHVRGSARIRDEFEKRLGIKEGETTPDKMFTFETVNCLGACALGPIVVINGEYHGNMTIKKVNLLLKEL